MLRWALSALVIVLFKGGVDSGGAPALWLALGLLIPLLLACSNVYRTLAWPAGTSGLALAAGTNLGAAMRSSMPRASRYHVENLQGVSPCIQRALSISNSILIAMIWARTKS